MNLSTVSPSAPVQHIKRILPTRFAPLAPATSTAASESSAPFLFWSGFIDCKVASVQGIPVQLFDRLLSRLVGSHLDKCKSTRSPGGSITHDGDLLNGSFLLEQLPQFGFSYRERQISDEYVSSHDSKPPVKRKDGNNQAQRLVLLLSD
jgi:hypothetical protein